MFAAEDPSTQAGGLCPREGPFGMRGEQQGGWWLRGRDIHREYVQRGDAPTQPPVGLNWLMGVG